MFKKRSEQNIYAATPIAKINGEEYSALFSDGSSDSGVIFSVEKVAVSSAETTAGIPEPLTGQNVKTFLATYDTSSDNETYTFKDVVDVNGNKSKTVVEDGKFVRLDNVYNNNKYMLNATPSLQEAVMVSFGAYVYDVENDRVRIAQNDDVSTPTNDTLHAGITYLEVAVKKNGVLQDNIPAIRNISLEEGGLYFDFVWLITQQEDNSNEGYYEINLKYYTKGSEQSAKFEFYMVNETSYTTSINPQGRNYGYNAKPTLGWFESGESGFEKTQDHQNYIRYRIGENGVLDDGISYPTITYDYTRYKLSFKRTANQKNITYDFSVNYSSNLLNQSAQLDMTRTESGVSVTKKYNLSEYDADAPTNLVTIMLSEPGSYVISYEYLYKGFNSKNAPEMGFVPEDIHLAIHGMTLNYSKTGFEGAKMQYFEIAEEADNNVDLVVLNAYNIENNDDDDDTSNGVISSLTGQKLGFMYKVVKTDEKREGTLLKTNSLNSLTNIELNNDKSTFTDETEFNALLANTTYVQTNQGSLWLEGNDAYTSNSFYVYSSTSITYQTLTSLSYTNNKDTINDKSDDTEDYGIQFTNTTSFNKKGYYLVFVQIKPNGITEDAESYKYWQMFAFQYTSSSTNINVEAIDDKNTQDVGDDTYEPVAGGKYTNKNVRISWKKPGIFDRNISAYYYSVVNRNIDKDELLLTTANTLNSYEKDINGEVYYCANLGEEVVKGSFVRYLIRLDNEGDSVTYKMFTIDRQNISGIHAYLIQTMYSNQSVYYAYATDAYNNAIEISNSVTDSYATLTWDNKQSGAEIFASYSYTPFSINNDTIQTKRETSGEWITTNYQLGTTILGADLYKSDSIYNVSSDCILFNQGIYIITLRDSAGNETHYAFVIDRTANYFNVEGTYLSNSSIIFGDDVSYSVGNYKAFKLSTSNETLNKLFECATTSNFASFENYYTGKNNNTNVLSNIFQKSGESYYLTIKNTKIEGYKDNTQDHSISAIPSGRLNYSVTYESYYKRTLYVAGENHRYSTGDIKDNSYVVVEINKDNARGMVYYSNDSNFAGVPTDGISTSSFIRLDTGSDNGSYNGLLGAHATSAKYVGFVWNMGTGSFEVGNVSYTFYPLKPGVYNDDKYYFYGSGETFELYNNGTFTNAQKIGATGLAVAVFNADSESKAGLYEVTRTYKDNADLGEDVQTRNYYFIVDRNGIIDANIGGDIKIILMENEIEFNTFSTQGTDFDFLSYGDDDIYNERYNIYLSTTKLPATLNIPTGKYYYFDENSGKYKSSAEYQAGQLNVSVYFNDVYGQLVGKYKNAHVKLFSQYGTNETDHFNINIYNYLSYNLELRNRMTISNAEGNWLFLPGHYIIRISDNVYNVNGEPHVRYIGFEISGYEAKGPQVETFTGYSQDNMIKINPKTEGSNYSATVSQKYLEVRLPNYEASNTSHAIINAQVDPNYIVVDQYLGTSGVGSTYINHPYVVKNGINLKENSQYVTMNADGSISVWLDTLLGQNDYSNPLSYTIKVRYKLNNFDLPYNEAATAQFEKYKDCYVYYFGNTKRTYYETTYTISIDRLAPTQNIDALNANDKLVQDYNEAFGTPSMIENGVHDSGSHLYFTKQYAKYYQENKADKGYVYAYQVDETTEFKTDDVSVVYLDEISGEYDAQGFYHLNLNLTLPLVRPSDYDRKITITNSFGGFYRNLNLTNNKYYEIIEQDAAGNTTQYVIHYKPAVSSITIPINVSTTSGTNEDVNISLDYESSELFVYNLIAKGVTLKENDNHFKIELKKSGGDTVFKMLTTETTNYETLTQTLVDSINKQGYGSFELIITVRDKASQYGIKLSKTQINLYDSNNVKALNIEDMVVVDRDGNYSLVFNNVDKQDITDDGNVLWYFATNITVKYVDKGDVANPDDDEVVVLEFIGKIENGIVKYYKVVGQTLSAQAGLSCWEDTTYHIVMKDVIENISSYRFNTSGHEFVILNFDKEDGYYESDDGHNIVYYAYTDATLQYDKTIYTSAVYKKDQGAFDDANITPVEGVKYNTITMQAIYDEATKQGGICEYKIELYFEGTLERTYYITLDTRLSNVAIRDYTTGEQRNIISAFNNKDFNDPDVKNNDLGSGIMNLEWSKIDENNYFDYQYTLYELLKEKDGQGNDVYRIIDLNDQNNYVIATGDDSTGLYKFEIAVLGKDGKELGNRIFAFEVQKVNNQIYYVRDESGTAINPNSTFAYVDYKDNSAIKQAIEHKGFTLNQSVNYPLYITNQDLELVVAVSHVNEDSCTVKVDSQGFVFTVYELEKPNAYTIYIGVLKINERQSIVNDVTVDTQLVTTETKFTITQNSSPVTITAKPLQQTGLLGKNFIELDVYYMNTLVETKEFKGPFDYNYTIAHEILGNGKYSFIFKDKAGNVHKYVNEREKLDVDVLREVAVTINEQAPVDNAYYNGEVSLVVVESSKYVTGSIRIEAYKNGESYIPNGYNPYVFSDYGTYRVYIYADFQTSQGKIQRSKVVTFTILNVKEARKSIDLTGLGGCKIDKVTNQNGLDVTDAFIEMMGSSTSGMNITYDKIMEHAGDLKVTTGKQTFNLTYVVEDKIYPTRKIEISFTLNNEETSIACSLEKGESTTKGFTISFNAAVIYEKIGEAYVYINDRIVAHINENSPNEEQSIATTYKEFKDGDYYITLVSSSGVILESYKVTIKEPLNFWAIVVIIVIVGVVVAVVTTIVVLRRKMRIR